jgi:hypothetical protein
MDTSDKPSKKRQRLDGEHCPPENAAQVQAHKMLWEGKLQDLIKKKGNSRNAQFFDKDRIANIILQLERFNSMTWPVRLVKGCI